MDNGGILSYPQQCAGFFADRYSRKPFILNMTMIRTWRMRLDLTVKDQQEKGAYKAEGVVLFCSKRDREE